MQVGVATAVSVTASGRVAVSQKRMATLTAGITGAGTTGATNGVATGTAATGAVTATIGGQVVSTTAPGGRTRGTDETTGVVVRRSVSAFPSPRFRTRFSPETSSAVHGASCAPWAAPTLKTSLGTW